MKNKFHESICAEGMSKEMSLQFILGLPGTGKTTLVLNEIRAKIAAAEPTPLYYLVPEQFSLQSERLLLAEGREAATRVQVLSFNRLAYRLFSVLGTPQGKHADDLGKQMLLRKVLFETSHNLEYYKSASGLFANHGFIAELSHTITELNHYGVSAEDLTERAEHSTPALAAKLRDTALILKKYRAAVTNRYLLTDDMPRLLCRKIEEVPANAALPLLDDAYFWADGFSGFTPQERQVLLHIMKRAKKLSITLTIKDEISAAPRETISKLEELARSARIKILPAIHMKENFRHANAPELAYFVKSTQKKGDNFKPVSPPEKSPILTPRQSFALQNFDTPLGKGVTPPSQANNLIGGVIEIIAASDRYTAVYAAAARIQQMRQNGWDFRDIAILCGDRSHYEKILQTVFDRLNIPMFVDTETDILSHPLTEMIRAALDICIKNWDYESVFRFLKTRLTGISPDAVDILENFVLANGISSYRWQYPFKEALVQPAQAQLLKAMEPFKKHADSVDTFRNHSKRVFDMLYSLNVPETLQRWILIQNDDPAVVRLHTQIWPKLCEVFDKLVEILGDEKVSLKTFAATLDAGLCQVGLGRIPPTVDQIVLGDISRSRYPQIKAMIVLGANDGVLPQIPVQSGLFTDHERGLLKNSRLELAPDNFRKMSESNYNLYCALSQPSDKLIFIYAQTNGKPLRPAPIIHKIKRLFPNLAVTPAPLITEYYETNGQPTEIFNPVALAPATVSQIYEQKIYTAATRLEAFARCPFAYYMNYILGAKPRKHYEILPTDLGKLFHDVVAGFTNRVKDFNVKDFNVKNFDLSRYEINKIVDELVTGLNLENSVFHDTARNKHILTKLRRVAAASCWALSEQIRRGVYVPAMTEQEISGIIPLENGKSLHISGRIDRVDIAKNEDGSELLQIIDYKTGSGKFSTDEVLKGVQLQLMLYMNLLTKSRKNALPGGVFYFRADDPIIQTDIHLDEHARNEALLKAFKMSGIEAGDSREFTLLSAQTENKIKELGTRLTLGDISAAPYTKGAKCPCNFCAFTGVCNNAKG